MRARLSRSHPTLRVRGHFQTPPRPPVHLSPDSPSPAGEEGAAHVRDAHVTACRPSLHVAFQRCPLLPHPGRAGSEPGEAETGEEPSGSPRQLPTDRHNNVQIHGALPPPQPGPGSRWGAPAAVFKGSASGKGGGALLPSFHRLFLGTVSAGLL